MILKGGGFPSSSSSQLGDEVEGWGWWECPFPILLSAYLTNLSSLPETLIIELQNHSQHPQAKHLPFNPLISALVIVP